MSRAFHLYSALAVLLLLSLRGSAASPLISEILFNPPGTDSPNEYIELRGTPNTTLPQGTYLLSVEGDAGNNPGTLQNLFDLSGRSFGGNGFLVLLQKASPYVVQPFARTYAQTGDDPGWGHAGGSSLKHRGEAGQTDLENPSCTFFLIESAQPPSIGDDIDADDNGTLDGPALTWVIHDSVGILDADGAGDIVYGKVNFRRSQGPGNGGTASGTVVSVNFTPGYVARANGTGGTQASDWIASELPAGGTAPNYVLGDSSHTAPSSLAGQALNHIGAANFGAPPPAGIIVLGLTNAAPMPESGATNQYSLMLTLTPSSEVQVEIAADDGLEVSVDQGLSFGPSRIARLTQTAPVKIWVRTVENTTVELSPHPLAVRHRVLPGLDSRYNDALVPPVTLAVLDNDSLLLNEIYANPLNGDGNREYVEIRGVPNALLKGVRLLVLDTEFDGNPGDVLLAVDLDGVRLGANGLLMLAAPNHPYSIPLQTKVIAVDAFGRKGGALPNDSLSMLLITGSASANQGDDLDNGDNGILEGLSRNTVVLDSVAWLDGHNGDLAYGPLLFNSLKDHPDAATRKPGANAANDASAWYYGDIRGDTEPALRYDRSLSSANTPPGATLTPGNSNNSIPTLADIHPLCGAIGDPTNPRVSVWVSDAETAPELLRLSTRSSNPSVIQNSGIQAQYVTNGEWQLRLDPIGVGYSDITVFVSDGQLTNDTTFHYAASGGGTTETRYLIGAGDGSTAIPLTGDLILVGDDENQFLRLYDRTRSSLPLARYNMNPFLGLTDIESGVPREVDIEGSTRVGNRLFWMGAHSHASIAEQRTNRSRIFATDLRMDPTGPQLSYVGRYDYLKLDLVDWDNRNLHGKGARYYGLAASTESGVDPKAVDGSGFNLEGLAMAPGSTEIGYIACRAPLASAVLRTHALIIPVLNFATLAASDAPPGSARFGVPIELDLFNRGIRSIEGVGDNYLIIAGPPGPAPTKYPNDFRLYTWTGKPQDAPVLRTATLAGLNPEGIVELPPAPWTAATRFQILSDSGTRVWYGDGVITKELPETNFKKCRLDWVTLGESTKPQPILLSFKPEGRLARMTWRSLAGETYQIQWSDTVAPEQWHDLAGGSLRADGPFLNATVDLPRSGRHYFRLISTVP